MPTFKHASSQTSARVVMKGKKKPVKKKAAKKPKYKGAAGNLYAPAYNTEIFQYTLAPQTANFATVAAVAGTQSANTKVFLGALYNRNTTPLDQAIRGVDVCPKFYTDKYRISFEGIVPDVADSNQGFLLRMHVVQVKIAPNKVPVANDTQANWATGIEALVNREVALSNITADYLEFAKQNRNIRVISTEVIKPNRSQMIRKNISAGTAGENYSCPPPVCRTIKHQIPQFKQTLAARGSTAPKCEQMYVNAVIFTCHQLTANTGHFVIDHSSKFYFTDS
jgi:hypothetical protein